MAYEGEDCLPWPFARDGNGYGRLKREVVSRIVCERTNGPPPSKLAEAAHSCGNGHLACVAKRHLSWKTRKGNAEDMVEHGTSAKGERNGNAKLTDEEARQIFDLKGHKSQQSIADLYGVTQPTVSLIHLNKSHARQESRQ